MAQTNNTDIKKQKASLDEKKSDKISNCETLAAIEEFRDMLSHPEKYKSYNNVDEMFEDILSENS